MTLETVLIQHKCLSVGRFVPFFYLWKIMTKLYLKSKKMKYSTDLTDKQWQVIEKFLDDKERKRKHSLRSIFNAIFYLVKIGCQ